MTFLKISLTCYIGWVTAQQVLSIELEVANALSYSIITQLYYKNEQKICWQRLWLVMCGDHDRSSWAEWTDRHHCLQTSSREMVKQEWLKLCSLAKLDGHTGKKNSQKVFRFNLPDSFDLPLQYRTISPALTWGLVSVLAYVYTCLGMFLHLYHVWFGSKIQQGKQIEWWKKSILFMIIEIW